MRKLCFNSHNLKHSILQVTNFPVLVVHLKGRICSFPSTRIGRFILWRVASGRSVELC
jgi:hypothetical protein